VPFNRNICVLVVACQSVQRPRRSLDPAHLAKGPVAWIAYRVIPPPALNLTPAIVSGETQGHQSYAQLDSYAARLIFKFS
jgi:hypothetical protein